MNLWASVNFRVLHFPLLYKLLEKSLSQPVQSSLRLSRTKGHESTTIDKRENQFLMLVDFFPRIEISIFRETKM